MVLLLWVEVRAVRPTFGIDALTLKWRATADRFRPNSAVWRKVHPFSGHFHSSMST